MKPLVHHLRMPAGFLLAWAAFLHAGTLSAQQSAPAPSQAAPWEIQNGTSKAGLRGIHAVGGGVAWASGTDGTVLRTEDGGYVWQSCAMPPGAEKLDFRGIWAWDANTAVVMSSGPGDLSRLYKTTDGCSSWKLLYINPDKDGFWDAVQFWDKDEGVIFGDPVGGVFTVLRISMPAVIAETGRAKDTQYFPSNLKFESAGAFAASNSSMVLGETWKQGDGTKIWLGTGGRDGAKVLAFRTHNVADVGSAHWTSSAVPLASGNDSSGVFSLAFRDQNTGIAAGGDYKKPNESTGTAAYTTDGGKTWTAAAKPPHGYRSSVAWDGADKAWIAAGPNGSDVSYDDGKTWRPLDNGNWNALSLPWIIGPEGRIAKLVSLKPAGK
jgi:photosystem II stability/assembly factor-like uncharacterized protein